MAESSQGVYAIGVDVGGTKGAAGFVDSLGEITQHTRVPINPRGNGGRSRRTDVRD
jgi:predicted NBD/HSP70 family sugar kinase